MAKACSQHFGWWLDCGNIKTAGQVSVGRGLAAREPSPLRFPSMTTWTPLPSVQFPGILEDEPETKKEEVDYSGMSCAEIALVDEQGLSINPAIATTAAAMLMKLLVTKDLQHHCAYVSIDSGTTFVYNSPRILTDYLKNMEFVSVEGATEYDDQEDMEQAMLDEEDGEEPLFEEDLRRNRRRSHRIGIKSGAITSDSMIALVIARRYDPHPLSSDCIKVEKS